MKYDFGGWATRYNTRCSDSRTILTDAFKDNDKNTVPLVYNHDHKDARNILGHAVLENRRDGVYAYCTLNETEQGKNARELIKNGDVSALSIYANKLIQNGNNVSHGQIREVSIVLAGANPGAYIDNVLIHSDDGSETYDETKAILYNQDEDILLHSNDDMEVNMYNKYEEYEDDDDYDYDDELEHADDDDETVGEVWENMPDKYKAVCYAIIDEILKEKEGSNTKETEDMKHNVFENDNNENSLQHSDEMNATRKEYQNEILHSALGAHVGSFREYIKSIDISDDSLSHADYGIKDIDVLFPEATSVSKTPYVYDRDTSWVSSVMQGTKKSPFARVKSMYVDITADEARAKGYVKGNQKVEEVILAFKRTTEPQMIYKKQKFDRDDIIDITDFDVVPWIKTEMRGKLDEEIARAILIGDGRAALDADKIKETNVRPILGDDSVYTISSTIAATSSELTADIANTFIENNIKVRKEYRGSGNMTMFMSEDLLSQLLLLKDLNKRFIYTSEEQLRSALRVSKIVTVPQFNNHVRTSTDGTKSYSLLAISVNLQDYNVGTDKGGAVNMFDDFDIDFNQYKYLMEAKMSGALVVPKSAITFEIETPVTADGD